MNLEKILDKCIELNASDINITSEQHLAMRINRDIFIFNDYEHHLSVYDVQDICTKLFNSFIFTYGKRWILSI